MPTSPSPLTDKGVFLARATPETYVSVTADTRVYEQLALSK